MSSINVLVTGVGGGSFGEQILKALRLAKTKYHLVAADVSRHSTGFEMADTSCILPFANNESYLSSLVAACRAHSIDVLFPGSENELRLVSKHRQLFLDAGIFLPINSDELIEICLDKNTLFDRLAKNCFEIPQFRRVAELSDIRGFDLFPMVLKPSRGSGGSANVFIAQDPEERDFYARSLLKVYSEFVAQEYVGTPDHEYTVGVLADMDGNLLNSIVLRRYLQSALSVRTRIPNRTGREELGAYLTVSTGISQGIVESFPTLAKQCEDMALSLGVRGTINVQCRFSAGKAWLLEINPRFSGTTSLRALTGYNEPDLLIRKHLLNERIEPFFPYRRGVILRRLHEVFFPDETVAG